MGGMPSAGKIEARRAAEQKVVERIRRFLDSPEYARFRTLESMEAKGDMEKARERCRLEKTKYDQTAEGRAEQELKSFRKSSEYKWFLKQEKKGIVSRMEGSPVSFFDDFSASALNRSLWSTRFFWGDANLGKAYSFVGDGHAYTDGGNVTIQDQKLVITTRPERCSSMAWDEKLGFLMKDFNYTSGLVTTGKSFRLRKGEFEAKVRFTAQEGVYHAFYLVGDTRLPQVDVFRSLPGSNRQIAGVFTPGLNSDIRAEVGSLPYSKEFFILGVEVSDSKIIWKINGVPYMEQSNNLPKTPLYLVFASGVEPDANPQGEARLEIDWVRCAGSVQ